MNETPERPRGQFRRNQTLSGVRRSTAEEPSSRHQLHHLTTRRRKVGGIFLIAVAVVALLAILLTQLTAQVSLVGTSTKVTSSFASSDAKYREAISSYFGTHPAERLRFALNEQTLSAYVGSLYPEVKSLEVHAVKNAVETQFLVHFREPVAGWQIRQKQYYVDSEGVVFERNYFAHPAVQIVDESGVTPEEGTAVASSRLLGFVGKVVALGQGRGYTAVKAVLPADTTRRLDVTYKDVTPVIRFSIDREVGEQVSDMAAALTHIKQNGLRPTYLDVRVAGRAVYR